MYLVLVAVMMGILSGGDFSGIGNDFSFYFDRLVFIRDFSPPFWDWFSTDIGSYPTADATRVSDWVPSPFYSVLFLGPLLLHQSQLLFALQGVFVAWLSLINIRFFVHRYYCSLGTWALNACILLSALNPAFLKDALTSGPTSICNLCVLIAFRLWQKPLISSLFFAFAAMTRSSYFLYVLSMCAAGVLVSSRSIRGLLMRIMPSVIAYLIFYKYFFSSYPGSGFSYIFVIGLQGMDFVDNYFLKSLSTYYPVNTVNDVLNLNISITDLTYLIMSDVKIAYGVFVIWIFKIISFLGFPHLLLFWDMRSIWIQRLVGLIYFIFVMAPGFVLATFALCFARIKRTSFWIGGEREIVLAGVLFTLFHSLIMGTPRYSIVVSWIFSAFLVRFACWFRSVI